MRNFDEAIKNHSLAIDIRTEFNKKKKVEKEKKDFVPQIFTSYRRIIGCFAEIKEYTPNYAKQAVDWIIKTLNYVNDNNTLQDYEKMSTEINIIINKLPASIIQEKDYTQKKDIIDELMNDISDKSINS